MSNEIKNIGKNIQEVLALSLMPFLSTLPEVNSKLWIFKQGTVALWSNASVLDRKIEGSNLAANSYFWNERPRRARKKETNLETKIEEGTPAKRTTLTR